VAGDLGRTVAQVGHVAVGARDAGARVHALAPQLEFRVLRLEDGRAGFRVLVIEEPGAIGEFRFVPELLDLPRPQALAPREGELHLRGAVVLDVALAAHVGPQLVARRFRVGVVGDRLVAVAPALDRWEVRNRHVRSRQQAYALDESRARDAQLHGLGIVAVAASDRVRVTGIVQLLV